MNIDAVYELERKFQIAEAFRALLPDLHRDDEVQELFLEILRADWNLFLIAQEPDLMAVIEAGRKERDGYLSYAYARYLDCVRPHEASIYNAEEAYDIAIDAGIWDAIMFKAYAWLYGEYLDLGKSEQRYITLRDDAAKRGSKLAMQQQLLDLTFGRRGYDKPEPLEAYNRLEPFITACEQRHLHLDPSYYRNAGFITEELGRILEADMWYEKAIAAGDQRSFFPLAMIRSCGKDYKITDVAQFEQVMQRGREVLAPDTLYSKCYYLENKDFESMSSAEQQATHEAIKEGLEKALALGDNTAAYFLASYYRDGLMGFETDYQKAYEYAQRGVALRYEDCKDIMTDVDGGDDWDEGDDGRYDAWA